MPKITVKMLKFLSFITVVSLIFIIKAETNDFLSPEPIAPLPVDLILNIEKVALGNQLFHEKKLSKDNTISCASCHALDRGGVDGRVKSIGIKGEFGEINAPTVFNSGFNFRQFWDGRAKTLEEQIDGPIQHPKEMGAVWSEVILKLKLDKSYLAQFNKLYEDGLTQKNVKDAISIFERALITPNSKFDQFLRGNKNILSEKERTGYQRFKSYGCIACHQGMNVGGNMFQTMGVMGNYFKDRGTPITQADLGRFNVTQQENDKHVFRVPSLRNVELSAPYFHDGSVKTLDEAVTYMAKYQLGRKLSKEEIESIVAFLKTLTGDPPSILKNKNVENK
jgi:cytochrome c peroxidase